MVNGDEPTDAVTGSHHASRQNVDSVVTSRLDYCRRLAQGPGAQSDSPAPVPVGEVGPFPWARQASASAPAIPGASRPPANPPSPAPRSPCHATAQQLSPARRGPFHRRGRGGWRGPGCPPRGGAAGWRRPRRHPSGCQPWRTPRPPGALRARGARRTPRAGGGGGALGRCSARCAQPGSPPGRRALPRVCGLCAARVSERSPRVAPLRAVGRHTAASSDSAAASGRSDARHLHGAGPAADGMRGSGLVLSPPSPPSRPLLAWLGAAPREQRHRPSHPDPRARC